MLGVHGRPCPCAGPPGTDVTVLSVDMLRVSHLGHRGRQLGSGEVPRPSVSVGGLHGVHGVGGGRLDVPGDVWGTDGHRGLGGFYLPPVAAALGRLSGTG